MPCPRPNPRLQRTRSASPPSPLSRQPLGDLPPFARAGRVVLVVIPLLAFCLGCCGPCMAPCSAAASASQTQKASRIDQFQGLTSGMTLEAVQTLCGPPDRDARSEKIEWLYVLADGSAVVLGTGPGDRVSYAYHQFPDGKREYLVGRN